MSKSSINHSSIKTKVALLQTTRARFLILAAIMFAYVLFASFITEPNRTILTVLFIISCVIWAVIEVPNLQKLSKQQLTNKEILTNTLESVINKLDAFMKTADKKYLKETIKLLDGIDNSFTSINLMFGFKEELEIQGSMEIFLKSIPNYKKELLEKDEIAGEYLDFFTNLLQTLDDENIKEFNALIKKHSNISESVWENVSKIYGRIKEKFDFKNMTAWIISVIGIIGLAYVFTLLGFEVKYELWQILAALVAGLALAKYLRDIIIKLI